MNGSSQSLHSVINTLQELSFTRKERGRQIITFIGHSFSRVNKDPLEKAWLVAGIYIYFSSISKIPLAHQLYITPVEALSSAQYVKMNLPLR